MSKSFHVRHFCPCQDCYNVHHCKYGILISGPLPLDDAGGLLKLFNEIYGYDLLDGLVSEKTRSTFALTTKEGSILWRKELNIEDIPNE